MGDFGRALELAERDPDRWWSNEIHSRAATHTAEHGDRVAARHILELPSRPPGGVEPCSTQDRRRGTIGFSGRRCRCRSRRM